MEIEELTEPPSSRQINLNTLIPKTAENNFFYKNGLSKIITRLTVKVHSDISQCEYLWKQYSKNQTLFQLWDFRKSWFEGYQYTPFFYTIYEGKKIRGVLPLWFNEDDKIYEWFGGYWPEDNVFFVDDPAYIALLLKIAPNPLELLAILPESIEGLDLVEGLQEDEYKFILDIGQFRSMDQLLQSLSKKHRHNLRHEYHKFDSYPLETIWQNTFDEKLFGKLIGLSKERFGESGVDASSFMDPKRCKTIKRIAENQGKYKLYFLFVKIQNHLALVDVIATYKNTYHLLIGGANDTSRFPGIGVFITYFEFEDAIRRGMDRIDVLQIDNNWKHKYFAKKRMLKFVKK